MGIEHDFDKMWRNAKVTKQVNPETGEEMEVVGVELGLPGRQFERHRRCQNCMHFSTSDAALHHLRHCISRDARTLVLKGNTRAQIARHIAKLRQFERGFVMGKVGRCVVIAQRTDEAAKKNADFTDAGYLCDRWSNPHITFTDVPVSKDPLSEELYDNLGEVPAGAPKNDEGKS